MKPQHIINIPTIDIKQVGQLPNEIYGVMLAIADLEYSYFELQQQFLRGMPMGMQRETESDEMNPEPDLEAILKEQAVITENIGKSKAGLRKLEMEWELQMALLKVLPETSRPITQQWRKPQETCQVAATGGSPSEGYHVGGALLELG